MKQKNLTKTLYIRNIPLGDGIPQICVPITGRTLEEILAEVRQAAAAGADLIEWRMDYWDERHPKAALEEALYQISAAAPEIPLIFTIRTREEGGNLDITQEKYEALNLIAAETGKADLIDVEYFRCRERMESLIRNIQSRGARVIASSHDFEKTGSADALMEKYRALDQSGGDILKIAVMPVNPGQKNSRRPDSDPAAEEKTETEKILETEAFEDTDLLMECTRKAMREITERPVIAIAMGSGGRKSRTEAERFGSCITFGTVSGASAPGQIPIGELRALLEDTHKKLEAEEAGFSRE